MACSTSDRLRVTAAGETSRGRYSSSRDGSCGGFGRREADILAGAFGGEGDPVIFRVVTFVTGGWLIEPPFPMAVCAIYLGVILIQKLAGNTMVKGRRIPFVMAAAAVGLLSDERHGGVACPATAALVIAVQRPTGIRMVKFRRHRPAVPPMTPITPRLCVGSIHVALMASQARAVMFE